jgi:hypothetical protein
MPHVLARVKARPQRMIWLAGMILLLPAAICADTITLVSSRDTTLYKDLPNNSNGAGQGLFVGTTGQADPRRALIGFDIANNLPAGSIITAVQLTLVLDQAASGDTRARPIELHRLLANWGEGTTGQGMPGPKSGRGFPTPSNGTTATWTNRFHNTTPWANAGGDFVATASGSTLVGSARQAYAWDSTPMMLSDVQAWLDDPASNFGWLLLGDESATATARRFDTREFPNSNLRPALKITFSGSAVPEPFTLPLLALGTVGLIAYVWRQQKRAA